MRVLTKPDSKSVVVVFSGGQDSTTGLLYAKQHFEKVFAVSFDYGQRHQSELVAAKYIANQLQVKHEILSVPIMGALAMSSLTSSTQTVPETLSAGIPNTFVPGRNILFLSIAAVYAYRIGCSTLLTGVCEVDYSGYPDCRNAFIQSLQTSLQLGFDYPFNILTPFMFMTKAEMWALAEHYENFALVLNQTVTCYHGQPGLGCQNCPACLLRQRGLDRYRAAPSLELNGVRRKLPECFS